MWLLENVNALVWFSFAADVMCLLDSTASDGVLLFSLPHRRMQMWSGSLPEQSSGCLILMKEELYLLLLI